MRKMITACLLLAALLVSVPTSAQVKFGVKGGLNLASFSFSGDDVNSDNQTGFYIGPTVKIGLPLTGLSLDGSLLYNQVSAKVNVEEGSEQIMQTEETLKQKQLAIPVNLRYGFGIGDAASVFFFAGPQFAFDMSSDIDNIDWKWKNTYLSINVGGGLMLASHLQINLNYNIGCGNTGNATATSISKSVFHAKSNAVQLGLASYF